MPDLVEVGKKLIEDKGRLVLVSYDLQIPGAKQDDATLERVRAFLAKRGFTGDCFVLEAEEIPTFDEHFTLTGAVPETLALDARLEIVERHQGAATREDFQLLVSRLKGR